MYSPNAAKEEGRRIGRRHADVWVSDDDLRAAVGRVVGPIVRPQNGRLRRDADQMRSWTLSVAVLSAMSAVLFLVVTVYGQADWMPKPVGDLPVRMLAWVVVGLVALTALSWVLCAWAARLARVEQRRLTTRWFERC